MRDRDANTVWFEEADATREERYYVLQNWRHDVSLMLTHAGSMVQWVKYSAYGVPFGLPAGDTDSDGDFDSADIAAMSGSYDLRKDANLDGSVDFADVLSALAVNGGTVGLGRGRLSADAVGNRLGYAGYEFDETFVGAGRNLYHVRHRVYDADLGRWTRRDPLGYVDGMGLYAYVGLMAIVATDPMGLAIDIGIGVSPSPYAARPIGGDLCGAGGGSLAGDLGTCGQVGGSAVAPLNVPVFLCFHWALHNPMPSTSDDCQKYDVCDDYVGANARCFCKCAGDSEWSQYVRACLRCMYEQNVAPERAHDDCYRAADKLFPGIRPWSRLIACLIGCSHHQQWLIANGWCDHLSPLPIPKWPDAPGTFWPKRPLL